jgi:hypothetical protein
MENKNPLIRLVTYGKLKKMMGGFEGKKLKPLERNLMRGLFIRKLKDFVEEQNAFARKHTWHSRLIGLDKKAVDLENNKDLDNEEID